MRCPFLQETRAKFCQASPYRKLIAQPEGLPGHEKCLTEEHRRCPSVRQAGVTPLKSVCPFLRESLVQYCSAAAVTKYIPYSESAVSRCGTDNHRFCDLILALAHPPAEASRIGGATQDLRGRPASRDEEIPIPGHLYYSANHMWLSISDDGQCHIGIDAFFARVMGHVSRLNIVTRKGLNRPAAVLTIQGTDFPMVFPNKMLITGSNNYLRANPRKLTASPYDRGWLFEGVQPEAASSGDIRDGLVRGDEAAAWMQGEVQRMNQFIHDHLLHTSQSAGAVMMDGGSFADGMAMQLEREELLYLINEFFPFYAAWRRSK